VGLGRGLKGPPHRGKWGGADCLPFSAFAKNKKVAPPFIPGTGPPLSELRGSSKSVVALAQTHWTHEKSVTTGPRSSWGESPYLKDNV